MRKSSLFIFAFFYIAPVFAANNIGKQLYDTRCAMCHGFDAAATGYLAHKSNPPTPDLTSPAFQKRLHEYPGVIVSSVILRPNGNLIPNILKENGVKVPPHTWTEDELRSLNQYMLTLIFKNQRN